MGCVSILVHQATSSHLWAVALVWESAGPERRESGRAHAGLPVGLGCLSFPLWSLGRRPKRKCFRNVIDLVSTISVGHVCSIRRFRGVSPAWLWRAVLPESWAVRGHRSSRPSLGPRKTTGQSLGQPWIQSRSHKPKSTVGEQVSSFKKGCTWNLSGIL